MQCTVLSHSRHYFHSVLYFLSFFAHVWGMNDVKLLSKTNFAEIRSGRTVVKLINNGNEGKKSQRIVEGRFNPEGLILLKLFSIFRLFNRNFSADKMWHFFRNFIETRLVTLLKLLFLLIMDSIKLARVPWICSRWFYCGFRKTFLEFPLRFWECRSFVQGKFNFPQELGFFTRSSRFCKEFEILKGISFT